MDAGSTKYPGWEGGQSEECTGDPLGRQELPPKVGEKARCFPGEIACTEMLETGLLCHEEEVNNSLQK